MDDPFAPPDSPPCDGCPAELLRDVLASPMGAWIAVVLDLEFAIQSGIKIGMADILYPEFLMLRTLAYERAQYESEEIKKGRRDS